MLRHMIIVAVSCSFVVVAFSLSQRIVTFSNDIYSQRAILLINIINLSWNFFGIVCLLPELPVLRELVFFEAVALG